MNGTKADRKEDQILCREINLQQVSWQCLFFFFWIVKYFCILFQMVCSILALPSYLIFFFLASLLTLAFSHDWHEHPSDQQVAQREQQDREQDHQ